MFTFLKKYQDIGLLIMRIGIGLMFMGHGYPKLSGGVERWERVGNAMASLGIDFFPAFWGFMAAFAEFFGGICILLGAFYPIAAFLIMFTMLVASIRHLSNGDSIMDASHAIESFFWFFGLMFLTPGKYSFDAWWASRKQS